MPMPSPQHTLYEPFVDRDSGLVGCFHPSPNGPLCLPLCSCGNPMCRGGHLCVQRTLRRRRQAPVAVHAPPPAQLPASTASALSAAPVDLAPSHPNPVKYTPPSQALLRVQARAREADTALFVIRQTAATRIQAAARATAARIEALRRLLRRVLLPPSPQSSPPPLVAQQPLSAALPKK